MVGGTEMLDPDEVKESQSKKVIGSVHFAALTARFDIVTSIIQISCAMAYASTFVLSRQ